MAFGKNAPTPVAAPIVDEAPEPVVEAEVDLYADGYVSPEILAARNGEQVEFGTSAAPEEPAVEGPSETA